jgi:hypothetical protein
LKTEKIETLPCLWIGMKGTILSKEIYRFSAISIKIPLSFFKKEEISPKIHIET